MREDYRLVPRVVVSDLDGVGADNSTPILSIINQEYGTSFSLEDITDWDWVMRTFMSLSGLTVDAASKRLYESNYLALALPIIGAQRRFQVWADQGAQIHIATSRAPAMREITFTWLAEHYPMIAPHNIHYREAVGPDGRTFKRLQVEKFKPDLYFEDDPQMIAALLAAWPEQSLGILRMIDQPWNRPNSEFDRFRTRWSDFE